MPPPAKGKAKGKVNRKRILIALGLVALVIVGYLYYRSRSGGSTTILPPSTDATQAAIPSDSTDGGGASSSPFPSTDDTSQFLSTLAGENQQLLASLLASDQALQNPTVPNGAPAGAGTTSEPTGWNTPGPAPSPPSAAQVESSIGVAPGSQVIAPYTVTSPSGQTSTQSLDVADVPPALANQPIVPITQQYTVSKPQATAKSAGTTVKGYTSGAGSKVVKT